MGEGTGEGGELLKPSVSRPPHPPPSPAQGRGDIGPPDRAKDLLRLLVEETETTAGNLEVDVVAADPSDNMVLACAVEGHADYIVSGDTHLLSLREYAGIPIITAAAFLDPLNRERPSAEGRGCYHLLNRQGLPAPGGRQGRQDVGRTPGAPSQELSPHRPA
jgi:hypothetical protein